jgi:hypothetical protein
MIKMQKRSRHIAPQHSATEVLSAWLPHLIASVVLRILETSPALGGGASTLGTGCMVSKQVSPRESS